jgi:uncharacterized protein with GYD domain
MAIQLSIDGLPALYQFKRDTIALCIEYAREVLASSHKTKIRRVDDRLAEIKTELYDIFCRWNFVALARGGFDLVTCLPSDDSFVILTDLYYYLRRFGVEAGDSIVEFPHEAFRAILETAKAGGGNGVVPALDVPLRGAAPPARIDLPRLGLPGRACAGSSVATSTSAG